MSLQPQVKRTSSIRSLPTKGLSASVKSSKLVLNGQSQLQPAPRPLTPSIEFQLSKKTAELTMIVQMLFVQLHSKEAECELWQRYYNEFGDTLLRELGNEKNLTAALRATISEQEAALKKLFEEAQLRAKDIEKFKTDTTIAQERSQQLSNIYNETLAHKNSLSAEVTILKNQLETQKEICSNLESEINRLSAVTKGSEKREKQSQTRLEKEILKLQGENRDLNAELNHLKTYADDMQAVKDKAEEERRLLAATVDSLRVDFLALKEKYDAQRAAPFVNPMTQLNKDLDSEERRRRIASARKNLRSAAVACNLLTDDPTFDTEIIQLRKELQRYKLELKNRDASFNRMFAAATNRPNNKNGNLITSDDEDEPARGNSKQQTSGLTSATRQQPNNTALRRIPLMPAQFSSSTANSVRRSMGTSANNVTSNKLPTTLPPVELNYK